MRSSSRNNGFSLNDVCYRLTLSKSAKLERVAINCLLRAATMQSYSVGFRAGNPDDAGPHFDLLPDMGAELLGRTADRIHAQRIEPFPDFLLLEDAVDLAVELE